jgi:hypothetical protein
VALIQSAALGGLLAGGLVAVALQWHPYGEGWERARRSFRTGTEPRGSTDCKVDPVNMTLTTCTVPERSILDLTLPALIGLNVGVGAGLLAAYLPDQKRYGPTWTRVLLIDLAAVAGVVGGGIAGCVADDQCLHGYPPDSARAKSAIAALIGGAVGAGAGVLLTRNLDVDHQRQTQGARLAPGASMSLMLLPTTSASGSAVPTVAAIGTF